MLTCIIWLDHTDIELDILKEEVATALKHLKEGKAAGFNENSAGEIRATGDSRFFVIHKLCKKIWEWKEKIPDDWGKAVTAPIFQEKDKKILCKLQRNKSS